MNVETTLPLKKALLQTDESLTSIQWCLLRMFTTILELQHFLKANPTLYIIDIGLGTGQFRR